MSNAHINREKKVAITIKKPSPKRGCTPNFKGNNDKGLLYIS